MAGNKGAGSKGSLASKIEKQDTKMAELERQGKQGTAAYTRARFLRDSGIAVYKLVMLGKTVDADTKVHNPYTGRNENPSYYSGYNIWDVRSDGQLIKLQDSGLLSGTIQKWLGTFSTSARTMNMRVQNGLMREATPQSVAATISSTSRLTGARQRAENQARRLADKARNSDNSMGSWGLRQLQRFTPAQIASAYGRVTAAAIDRARYAMRARPNAYRGLTVTEVAALFTAGARPSSAAPVR